MAEFCRIVETTGGADLLIPHPRRATFVFEAHEAQLMIDEWRRAAPTREFRTEPTTRRWGGRAAEGWAS